MRRALAYVPILLLGAATAAAADGSASLRGSSASMVRQHEVAERNDYSFLRSGKQVEEYVQKGLLVAIPGNADYEVHRGVSYPFGRLELRVFVERLALQYRIFCGEPLVVTSVTRPKSEQPGNAHPLSVHPTGMALDLRVPQTGECKEWLEERLLDLESEGILDVTRERNPPHYHIALFPDRYREIAAQELREDSILRAEAAAKLAQMATPPAPEEPKPTVAPTPESAPRGTGPRPWVSLAALPVLGSALAFHLHRRRRSREDEDAEISPEE